MNLYISMDLERKQLDPVLKVPLVSEEVGDENSKAPQRGIDSDLFWTTEGEIHPSALRKPG